MIFAKIICVIFIIFSLFIAVKPLEIMNFLRSILCLEELNANDFKVIIYRLSGIIGLIYFISILINI